MSSPPTVSTVSSTSVSASATISFDGYLLTPQQLEYPFDYCSIGKCPLALASFAYIPDLGGNLAYAAVFTGILLVQIILCIRYRTWTFLLGMFCGLSLEVIGYVGRVQLHYNPFLFNPFLEYLICLTIAPAFLSAVIYISLGRIVLVYGEKLSRLRPRTYTLLFVSCDILSLALQATGGGIAAGNIEHPSRTGVNIMIAGLSTQIVSLTLFILLCAEYGTRVKRSRGEWDPDYTIVRSGALWQPSLVALALATVTILIRCIFRVLELSQGFSGPIFNDEVVFMILEGPMIIITCLCLTVFHPGLVFHGSWAKQNSASTTKERSGGYKSDGATDTSQEQRTADRPTLSLRRTWVSFFTERRLKIPSRTNLEVGMFNADSVSTLPGRSLQENDWIPLWSSS